MEVVIEHLEPFLSRWLWLEYRHVSQMVGWDNLIFTNVRGDWECEKLSELGRVERNSVVELIGEGVFSHDDFIILDPNSPALLCRRDFSCRRGVIVGGILGDYPPRSRTRYFLTSRLPMCVARSLGPHQFSIDGAVYVALKVYGGAELSEVPIQVGFTIKDGEHHEIYLPYAYPLVDGSPLVAPGLIEYLKSNEIVEDEELLIKCSTFRKDF
ncbi:MAG: SAM-dependent methyltransferase [archaeon GB-1867-005]|nr:SAM-dependent methyltransferase [Candidatus Culexmicrobium cathedralense]